MSKSSNSSTLRFVATDPNELSIDNLSNNKIVPSVGSNRSADDDQLPNDAKSPWFSLWLANVIQFFAGIQFSIYFSSMWPYLLSMDPSAKLDFFGYVIAIYSIGQMFSSPLFGYWNQRTKSTKWPVLVGLTISSCGNLLYGLLPTIGTHVQLLMMIARFMVGFGSGVIGVLRAYIATASVPRDRVKANGLSFASFVTGLSIGPAIQAAFRPIGTDGYRLGALQLNMYTLPSYVVIFGSIVSMILLATVFVERYSGIISDEMKNNKYMVLPKFDRIAAIVCIFAWFVHQTISTVLEVIAAPYTIAMYNWSDEDMVLYVGILQLVSSIFSVGIYLSHALVPTVRNIDARKMILFGLFTFILYHLFTIPWPFFGGPLDFIPDVNGTLMTGKVGGCQPEYHWCRYTTRVPLPIYLASYTFLIGAAFPLVGSPLGSLYSRVLGPRKQGTMQGIFVLFGSCGRCVAPLFATNLFRLYGPTWPLAIETVLLFIDMTLICVFYKRLIPLKTVPRMKSGDLAKYKSGTLYRF